MTKQHLEKMNNCSNESDDINYNGWDPYLWPPFTQIGSTPPPKRAVKGSGALIYIDNSPPLIDGISSWWVTLHGHSNEYIANAISKQAKELEQIIFADFTHPQAEKLAQRLSSHTGLKRTFFSDNGSTAVEVALKIAYQWWQNINEPRQQIIAFEGAYHGDTFGAMALGERNLFNAPFEEMMFAVTRVPWPSTWWGDDSVEKREQKALLQLEQYLETPTAAVILEPIIQGAGGMALVRNKFLQEVEKLVKQTGALLISDEVLTGFGRCGALFASQRAGLQPDLMSLSKGLTGGFLPMGITMAHEKIFKAFVGVEPDKTFWHGHSFTANPLGCAAANASLDLLEQNPSQYKTFENRHRPHLEKLSKHKKVSHSRVVGTIAAFDLAGSDVSGYLNPSGRIVKEIAMSHGVFIRPLGEVIYLLPPLCISDEQLEQCYSTINLALEQA